jgi:hypothetical protein
MRNFKSLAIVTVFAASSAAHMFIQEPPPFADSQSKSPLDPSGSNFPCQASTLQGGTVTNLVAGQSQGLQFNLGAGANTAVHGGGSCQISVTYETDAAAMKDPTNWKVLHSFVGGCPTEALGNLDTSVACTGSGDTNCVNQGFTFNVPSEVQNGKAVLAWTWFNNVGNREMYMNCAPVSISGGSNQMTDLPAMFVANVGNGCSTTEDFNTDFPNPGNYVTKSTLNYPLKAPVGTCGSGPGSASVPSTNNTSPPASQASGGAFAEGASSAPAPAAATTMATVATGGAPAPAAATSAPAAAPPAAPPASSGSCLTGEVACSASGFYCIDSTHFGMCAFGCATPMAVAAGTSCTNNAIGFAKEKRHLNIRHARRHIFGSSH